MIGGLGLNAKDTRQAIEQLPPEITLSFVPYADGLQGWIDLARANGHEVLLEDADGAQRLSGQRSRPLHAADRRERRAT